MTPDDIRQQIELSVVEMIKAKLGQGSLTETRAQQISQIVLQSLQPGFTFNELFKAIAKLDDSAPELSAIIVPYLRDYEKSITQNAQQNVRNLIKQGQYDAAAKLAENVIKQDVEVIWTGTGNK